MPGAVLILLHDLPSGPSLLPLTTWVLQSEVRGFQPGRHQNKLQCVFVCVLLCINQAAALCFCMLQFCCAVESLVVFALYLLLGPVCVRC